MTTARRAPRRPRRGDRAEPGHPPVRRHHRRRHGADAASPCRCRTPSVAEGAAAAAGQQDGHGPGDGGARQADGAGLHVLRRLRPGQPPRRARQGRVVERDYPLLTPKEVNAAIKQRAAAPAGGRGRLHRHRRAHGRHRRDPQHQGVRGGEGPGVLPRGQGGEPRRPGLGARSSSSGPAPRRPTPSWSPRW